MAMKRHLEAMRRRLRVIGDAFGSDEKGLRGDGEAL